VPAWHHRQLAFVRAGAALAAAALTHDRHLAARARRLGPGARQLPHARLRADAAALIEALGLPPVVVVGHSMGAANALRLAIDWPELVRGVVAAGAFASFSDKPELVAFIRSSMLTLGDSVPRELAEAFQRETVAGPVAAGLIETMVDECLRTPAAVWRAAFAGLLCEAELLMNGTVVEACRAAGCPTARSPGHGLWRWCWGCASTPVHPVPPLTDSSSAPNRATCGTALGRVPTYGLHKRMNGSGHSADTQGVTFGHWLLAKSRNHFHSIDRHRASIINSSARSRSHPASCRCPIARAA
jgi:alpha/beta hydrolase fold